VSSSHFAVLLPGCSEPHAHDIGERMRRDIDEFAIDDGRGAILYVTLSIGLVCWEPARHPVESSERLATQMEAEAEAAMQKAERAGGNSVSVARLGLLML
jgi:GGDEF domain-containing protein